jgi:predicted DNA-binding protein
MSTISVRLPEDIEAGLKKIVKLSKRTKSSLIKEALVNYITDVLDNIESEKVMRDHGQETYTSKEVEEMVSGKRSWPE